MFKDQNQKYVELLNSEPQQLIIFLQELIDIIVHQFIRAGKFRFEDKNDIKQQVNEELIKKIPRIQSQFQGRSSLKTYLSVIVTNICNDIRNCNNKITHVSISESITQDFDAKFFEDLLIKEEIKKLKNTLTLYPKQKPRLFLLLKLKFRMPVIFNDFNAVHPDITTIEFERFMAQIAPYNDNKDIEIFSALTKILNKHENKNNTPDAMRKWIKQKIYELIDIMNGNPPVSNYNEETIQILFEKCYSHETLSNLDFFEKN
jgi:DNA-binding protein YbaB